MWIILPMGKHIMMKYMSGRSPTMDTTRLMEITLIFHATTTTADLNYVTWVKTSGTWHGFALCDGDATWR